MSVVILTKNEERNIERCLRSVRTLTNDILILDSGSTDKTIDLAKAAGARIVPVEWQGYSATKNLGNNHANFDWILSLDADEEVDETLCLSVQTILNNKPVEQQAYSVQRRMIYCGHPLRYGAVMNEYRVRLFHRKHAAWNQQSVHEDISFSKPVVIHKLKGLLLHYSYYTEEEHKLRLEHYARLSATQMKAKGLRSGWIKRLFSPLFGFIKNFVLKLGWLDGLNGYRYARNEMWYTYRKYQLLQED